LKRVRNDFPLEVGTYAKNKKLGYDVLNIGKVHPLFHVYDFESQVLSHTESISLIGKDQNAFHTTDVGQHQMCRPIN
jgi:hypothetical protein